MDGIIIVKIIFTRKLHSPVHLSHPAKLLSRKNAMFLTAIVIHLSIIVRAFPYTFLSLNGLIDASIPSPFSRSFFFLSSQLTQKPCPLSRKYYSDGEKDLAREFIGTRSALTRGKRNRYRDKMVGNSQSARFGCPSLSSSRSGSPGETGLTEGTKNFPGKKEAEEVIERP